MGQSTSQERLEAFLEKGTSALGLEGQPSVNRQAKEGRAFQGQEHCGQTQRQMEAVGEAREQWAGRGEAGRAPGPGCLRCQAENLGTTGLSR